MRFALDKTRFGWLPSLLIAISGLAAAAGGHRLVGLAFLGLAALWAGLHAVPPGSRLKTPLFLLSGACSLGAILFMIFG